MFKVSETEKKVLIIWLIIGILVLLAVLLINFNKKNNDKEDDITSPGTNYINDRNRYYTVKGAINKYYSYINAKDYDAILKILSDDYKNENHLDKENITNYTGTNESFLSYDTGKMCLKGAKSGVYVYVVEGTNVEMNTGAQKEKKYYQVTLDGNTSLFSITPIDDKTFGGVCNE